MNGTFLTSPTVYPNSGTVDSFDGSLIANWIGNIIGFPMFVIGMSGNILTLVVLLRTPRFRAKSFGLLLILLSLCDMGVLSTGLLRHCIRGLTWNQLAIRNLCHWCCKKHVYFTYVFLELSPWTLCLVTLERTIAIIFPLKMSQLCTRRRMFAAWLSILIILVSLNAVVIHKTGTSEVIEMTAPSGDTETKDIAGMNKTQNEAEAPAPMTYCRIVPFDDYFMRYVMPNMLGLIAYIIPGVVMIIMNAIIINGIRRAHYELPSARPSRKDVGRKRAVRKRDSSKTNMLLGISLLFLCTNLPLSVYYVGVHYWRDGHNLKVMLYSLLLHISHINNAFNFAMYCLRGRKFRLALRDLVSCNRKRSIEPSGQDFELTELTTGV